MSTDRSRPDNPNSDKPEITGRVRALRADEFPRTLAEDLIQVADDLRQLYTVFGLRPYRVFLVHTVWTGPARGMGEPVEASRREVLPTPLVEDMASTTRGLAAVGLVEEGSIRLREVSAKFSEDDLLGRTPDLRDPAMPRTGRRAVEFWYEVVQQRRADEPAQRRIYVPDAAADLKPDAFGWTVHLRRRQADPARDGKVDRSRF